MIDQTYRDNPCDYCIELECENHGVVCPLYKEEKGMESPYDWKEEGEEEDDQI